MATSTAVETSSTAGSSLLDQLDAAAKKTASAPQGGAAVRGVQSLNPDISVILDVTGGYGERAPIVLAGDDPNLGGAPGEHAAGFTVQEAEVAFQSIVDPFFRADLFLTIPNMEGVEVEEGFVTTTALPIDLQFKAGVFRSALGRQNGQHLHLQDFTRRPLINAAYLGVDGLRPPGVQLSWLLPLPFFLQLTGEAFSVAAPEGLEHLASFGGGSRRDLTYALELKTFVPASESVSFYAGVNAAFGRTAGIARMEGAPPDFEGAHTQLYGADLYIKFKPPNVSESYFSLAWTTEYFFRRVHEGPEDGGIYSQLVLQLARSWLVGVRGDLLGLPESSAQARVGRASASITYVTSEFARLRAYVEREFTGDPALSPQDSVMALLQLEIAMGAHGAHAF